MLLRLAGAAGLLNEFPFHKRNLFALNELVVLVAFARKQNDVALFGHIHRCADGLGPVGDQGILGIGAM